MKILRLNTSDFPKAAADIHAGDKVILSGTVYAARDAAHARIMSLLAENKQLPFPIKGATVYYAGPTPTPKGLSIGSCGPTTSSRMDDFSPALLDLGLSVMIGKGQRNREVQEAIIRNKAVYLCAIGGAGALASKCITSCEVLAFGDLGCESIKKLEFKDFPLIAAIDCHSGNLFER
jgi:fumarate hydratase subunit beta